MKKLLILTLLLVLFGLVACGAPAVSTITAEEGAGLIKHGRVTQIEVTTDWLYLLLDDRTQARVPRADTPESGLIAPFQPYDITPIDLLNIPIIPREGE